jgi:chromate transporter
MARTESSESFTPPKTSRHRGPGLRPLFFYFLKLGSVGFGGPVALTAIMQKELVQEKKWLPREEFDRAFPLIKAMPGALAFQTAAFIGHATHGFWGAALAGFGLVLPAAIMMVLLASFAGELHRQAWVESVLRGFQSGALALILMACLQLAKPFRRDPIWWILSLLALGLVILGVLEPLVILLIGLAHVLLKFWNRRGQGIQFRAVPLLELIWVAFSAGAFVFGTGLAALPWMESQMVQVHHWLTRDEFMEAVALGQITPGPVLVTVTYIGFILAGVPGAVLATLAVFIPGLIHMTTWFPRLVGRLSREKWIGPFSSGALAAVVATLIFVIYKYLPSFRDLNFWIFLVMSALLTWKRFPAGLIILASGLMGGVQHFLLAKGF